MRKSEYPEMENELYQWYLSQKEHVDRTVVQKKAIELYAKHYKEKEFTASIGWLNRFEQRRGIQKLNSTTNEGNSSTMDQNILENETVSNSDNEKHEEANNENVHKTDQIK